MLVLVLGYALCINVGHGKFGKKLRSFVMKKNIQPKRLVMPGQLGRNSTLRGLAGFFFTFPF